MANWERKLGVIVPSWNTVMEYEMQRMSCGAMSVHAERIRHTADTEENLVWMSTQAPAAAELLSHARVDAICYGCTGSGLLKSPQEDAAFAAELEAHTRVPTVTSSSAIVDALRALKVKRLSIASPYEPWMNEKLRIYIEAAGFEILAMKGLGTQAHSTVGAERIMELVSEVHRPQAEAIVISCSNFRTLDLIEALEKKYGKPVVTSNQAAMWKTLRRIGDRRAIAGAGRLFETA
jgi:maleate isomerase